MWGEGRHEASWELETQRGENGEREDDEGRQVKRRNEEKLK